MTEILPFVLLIIALVFSVGFWLIWGFSRAVGLAVERFLMTRYRARQWYDPPKEGEDTEKDEEEEWNFVKKALLLEDEPLFPYEGKREGSAMLALGVLIVLLLLYVLLYVAIDYFSRQSIDGLMRYESLIAVLVSIVGILVFAIYQRFKSRVIRASSRQKWIKDVRIILADLVSGLPETTEDHDLCQRTKMERNFRKLELHLNPSEKIHRSLLYAISFAYDANWSKDEQVEKNLRLKEVDDWRCSARCKAGIIRLSQILLKLEWEQTKKLR